MRWFGIAAAAVFVSGCAVVRPHDHVGVHFHADIGVAGSSSSENSNYYGNSELSGAGGSFSVAAGGAIAPNFILGGELWGTGVSDPSYRDDVNGSGTLTGQTYGLAGIGPTFKYYLMPANVFLSATPSFTRMSVSDDSSSSAYRSEWGVGLRASVGKEWQVVGGWGLGVAGVLNMSSNKDSQESAHWTTWGGGVVFSASFN